MQHTTFPVFAAHRGGGGKFGPENTMYSYRKSVECGMVLLELDVRQTRDKHLVMMHDATVERTTDGNGFVDDYSLRELRKLDAAYYYPELRGSGVEIPTLREFLDEFTPNTSLLFMFDFKDEGSIRASLEMIHEYNEVLHGRYILSSAFEDTNTLLCTLCDPTKIPITTHIKQSMKMTTFHDSSLFNYCFPCAQSIYIFILLPPTIRFWSRSLIEHLHEKGMRVLVCGDELSKLPILQQCIDYGVDYIMTDRPDLLSTLHIVK